MNDNLNQLPEAPASLNFFATTSKGWKIQITLRDHDELTLLDRFAALVQTLEEWQVEPSGNGRKPAGSPVVPAPAQDQDEPAKTETDTFRASRLVGATSAGKTYWKIKGGIYSKYGVTIWPEVLEGAGLGELTPEGEYDLQDQYKATVLLENGKPKKIVKLERSR